MCLFVCLSRSSILLTWKKILTWFLLHTTAPCLSQIVLKFGLHVCIDLSLPLQILLLSDPAPVNLSVGDIRSQIAVEWSEIAQRTKWTAYRKPPSLFWIVPLLTNYDLPFLQNGSPKWPQDQLCCACCHLVNIIEDIDRLQLHVCALSDVAFCQITFVPG